MSTKRYTNSVSSEPKSKQFAIRMRETVHKLGLKAAADENRSLASLMETLLIDYLKANGYLLNGQKTERKRK